MTYHRPLFTGNVLKVRLSCVKTLRKKQGEKSAKNHGKGKKIKIGVEYIPLNQIILPIINVFVTPFVYSYFVSITLNTLG